MFEQNIGRVVGEALGEELNTLCIDEVTLTELDFVDIGKPLNDETYVPVVVKSLVFES